MSRTRFEPADSVHLEDFGCPHLVIYVSCDQSLTDIEEILRTEVRGIKNIWRNDTTPISSDSPRGAHRLLVCYQDEQCLDAFTTHIPETLKLLEYKVPKRAISTPRSHSTPISVLRDGLSAVASFTPNASTPTIERPKQPHRALQRLPAQRNLQNNAVEILDLVIRYILLIANSEDGKTTIAHNPGLEQELEKIRALHRTLLRPSTPRSGPPGSGSSTENIQHNMNETLRNVANTLTLNSIKFFDAFASDSLRDYPLEATKKPSQNGRKRFIASSEQAASSSVLLSVDSPSRPRSQSGDHSSSHSTSSDECPYEAPPISAKRPSPSRKPVPDIWRSPTASSAPAASPLSHCTSDCDVVYDRSADDIMLTQTPRRFSPSSPASPTSPYQLSTFSVDPNLSLSSKSARSERLEEDSGYLEESPLEAPSPSSKLRIGHTRTHTLIPTFKEHLPLRSESDPTVSSSPRTGRADATQTHPQLPTALSPSKQPSIVVHPIHVMTPEEHTNTFATQPKGSKSENSRPTLAHLFGDIHVFNPSLLSDDDDTSSSESERDSETTKNQTEAAQQGSEHPSHLLARKGDSARRPSKTPSPPIPHIAIPTPIASDAIPVSSTAHAEVFSPSSPSLSSTPIIAESPILHSCKVDEMGDASEFARHVLASTRRDFPNAFSHDDWLRLVCPEFLLIDAAFKHEFNGSLPRELVTIQAGAPRIYLLEKWAWAVLWVLISRYFGLSERLMDTLASPKEETEKDGNTAKPSAAAQFGTLRELASLNVAIHERCAQLMSIKEANGYQEEVILTLPAALSEAEVTPQIDRYFTSTFASAHPTTHDEYMRKGNLMKQAITLNVEIHQLRIQILESAATLHPTLHGEVPYQMALNGAYIILGNNPSSSCSIL